MGTWGAPRSGDVHVTVALQVGRAERWCAGQAGLTLTHVVGAALARGIAAVPEANTFASLGRVRQRGRVDVSYVVDVGRGYEMTAHRVENADRVPPRQLARELTAAARRVRRGDDPQFGRSRSLPRIAPGALTRLGMAVSGFIAGTLGRPVPGVGLDAHPFGSALLSSVAAWDLTHVAPPLIPFARLGVVAVLGAAEERAVVRAGEVVPARVADLVLTLDHRLMDGAHAGHLVAAVRSAAEDPASVWPN